MTPFPNEAEERACLLWAIGSDYLTLPLQQWDERIRARTELDVRGNDEIEQSLRRVYTAWIERERPEGTVWQVTVEDPYSKWLETYDRG